MRRPIGSDDYWKLRCKELEGLLAAAAAREARIASRMLRVISEVASTAQAVVANYESAIAGAGQSTKAELAAVAREIGERVGMTGDPTTWEIDLGQGPEGAYIEGRTD